MLTLLLTLMEHGFDCWDGLCLLFFFLVHFIGNNLTSHHHIYLGLSKNKVLTVDFYFTKDTMFSFDVIVKAMCSSTFEGLSYLSAEG